MNHDDDVRLLRETYVPGASKPLGGALAPEPATPARSANDAEKRPHEDPDSIRPPDANVMDESNENREGSLTLPFTRLSSLVRDTPAEPNWVWEGYLAPASVALLAGRPKVGKTTLVFGLLEAVLAGESFLGRPTRHLGVLLLTEENPATLAAKAERWHVGEVHILTYQAASGTPWPAIVEQAVIYRKQHQLELLVVDTLAQWAHLAGSSENDAATVLNQLLPLQAAAGHGLSVLIISHQRKSGGDHGEAIRGSNAIAAGVDTIIELERPGTDNVRVLKAVSRFPSTPPVLHCELVADGYELRDAGAVKTEHELQVILEALRVTPAATADAIAAATAIPKGTVHRHLNTLDTQGRAAHTGRGVKGDARLWSPFDSPTSTPEADENESHAF